MNQTKTQRYVALDVLRGMTVAGMILVNNPGSWSHIFKPLQHAPWIGCTPTDLVFPFFLFCVGVALAFSFAKYGDSLNASSSKKLIKRGCLIFLVGLGLNMFPFYPTSPSPELTCGQNYVYWLQHLRIFGVLQRIALCYVLGGFLALWLKTPKKILFGLAAVTLLHWAVLWIFGGEPGWSTLEGNISGKIDVALLGENHVYHGYGIPFDPEGLLGVISGAGTVLLGYFIGQMIRHTEQKINAVAKLYTTALICLGLGCIWSIWLPISKPLWTGSYVLYAGGWAIMMLAFFIYFIDVKGKEKPFVPFKAMGMNPLFAFVMAGVIAKVFGRVIKWKYMAVSDDGTMVEKTMSATGWFYKNCCVSIFGNNEYASLMYALVFVAIFVLMAMALYRKKIIIKL
ncbi:MAG: heparan-alpha-glucosaminide N-acetyltransferase domain-containing protein [Bacteroidales bacterium]|nr:heparan-alpha-glucosaminide N-acetyltransferase domain-containing protein [Bacteroidales bacterium]